MCGGPDTPPPIKSAKCASVAPLIFGIINLLSILNALTDPLGALGGFLGGVMSIIAASSLLCCTGSGDDDTTVTTAKGKMKCAKICICIGNFFYFLTIISSIILISSSLACLAVDCSTETGAGAADPFSPSAGCVVDACEEWGESDWDCIQMDYEWPSSEAISCGSGHDIYVSEDSVWGWDEGDGTWTCMQNVCCVERGETPNDAGWIPLDDHTCTEDKVNTSYFCAFQEWCQAGVVFGIGGIVWALIVLSIGICAFCSYSKNGKKLDDPDEVSGVPSSGAGRAPVAQPQVATAMAVAVPMATAAPVVPAKDAGPAI